MNRTERRAARFRNTFILTGWMIVIGIWFGYEHIGPFIHKLLP